MSSCSQRKKEKRSTVDKAIKLPTETKEMEAKTQFPTVLFLLPQNFNLLPKNDGAHFIPEKSVF